MVGKKRSRDDGHATEEPEETHERDVEEGSEDEGESRFMHDQTLDEKRKLRQQYRKLQDNLEFTTSQEASLDSKVLVMAADMSAQRAARMKVAGKAFDLDEFIDKLITKMGGSNEGGHRNDDNDDDEGPTGRRGRGDQEGPLLDWYALGEAIRRSVIRAPTSDFMFGPLEAEVKVRKVARKATTRLEKDLKDLQKPQELQEADLQKQENETSKTVSKIHKVLKKAGPTNFFNFVVNPNSFGQSVENLFYASFLIRDGLAGIQLDTDNQPVIYHVDEDEEGEGQEGLIKRQFIFELTEQLWKDIIQAYGIDKPMIPTRALTSTAPAGGKWAA
ncbi:nuclear protein [Chytridiales sp. JEL 0842]|nr:nuclear protein [Chytridiales sp. JEL 0842]